MTNLEDCTRLSGLVQDDYRATPQERELASSLEERCRNAKHPNEREPARMALKKLWEEVSARGFQTAAPQKSGRSGHSTLGWIALDKQLTNAEVKWGRVANVQFWLGIVTVPAVLIGAGLLVVNLLHPLTAASSALLSLVVGAAVTHSFLVLRVHQQARLAEERIVEKRVGLAFLRVAVEEFAGVPEFEAILGAGTKMFLGHYVAATLPLSAEDLKIALKGNGS